MTEWQPIETAPKDGGDVVVWDGEMHIASWVGMLGWCTGPEAVTVHPSLWTPAPTPPAR